MKYIVLLQVPVRGGMEIQAATDDDGKLKVFSSSGQAHEWAQGNGAAKVNGCQILPVSEHRWDYP